MEIKVIDFVRVLELKLLKSILHIKTWNQDKKRHMQVSFIIVARSDNLISSMESFYGAHAVNFIKFYIKIHLQLYFRSNLHSRLS